MFNWIDITAKQEQYQDLLRQAEKERFISQAFGRKQRIRLSQTINWIWATWQASIN